MSMLTRLVPPELTVQYQISPVHYDSAHHTLHCHSPRYNPCAAARSISNVEEWIDDVGGQEEVMAPGSEVCSHFLLGQELGLVGWRFVVTSFLSVYRLGVSSMISTFLIPIVWSIPPWFLGTVIVCAGFLVSLGGSFKKSCLMQSDLHAKDGAVEWADAWSLISFALLWSVANHWNVSGEQSRRSFMGERADERENALCLSGVTSSLGFDAIIARADIVHCLLENFWYVG